MTQEVHFGVDSLVQLRSILVELGARKIFLVTGTKSFSTSGAEKRVGPQLDRMSVLRFYDFSTNPKIEDVCRGVELFRSDQFDVIVGLGGGSVIDMAKAINIAAAQEGASVLDVIQCKQIDRKGIPLIAIPTTCGSGSEATHFGVVYIDRNKFSLAHNWIRPDVAIIDPRLALSAPKNVKASSGLDALCQAIEAFWSVDSTEESRGYSQKALTLITGHLCQAVNEPTLGCMAEMARGAFLAGKAINIAKTTAAHAVSYPMTANFGVAHGLAATLTLPEFVVFNSGVVTGDNWDKRGVDHVRNIMEVICNLLGCNDSAQARMRIFQFIREVGFRTELSSYGISGGVEVELIVENVNWERLQNNPRALSSAQIRCLLEDRLADDSRE